jgi:hypothetical protein
MSRAPHVCRRRSGYTTLEMVVALPSLALLLVGSSAAIGIVCRTSESGAANDVLVRGPAALEMMSAELECAIALAGRSATMISVVTPDRTGDAANDTITYSWSGTAGAPLTRQVNGGAAESLVRNVQSFALTHNTALIDTVQVLQSVDVRLSAATGAPELSARMRLLNEPAAP